MRPLNRDRRIAGVCAACAAILPGAAALLSQRQIASVSHAHELLTGIAFGTCSALLGASTVLLIRGRIGCSRADGGEA